MPGFRPPPASLPSVTAWMSLCMLVPDWAGVARCPAVWGTTALFGLVSSVALDQAGKHARSLVGGSKEAGNYRKLKTYKGRF
jgi:hypothetical protein